MSPVIPDAESTRPVGLSASEVAERFADGRVNQLPEPPGRTLQQIIRANVLTRVNGIMIVLFILVLISGNWRDGLFVGVVISNSVIGVSQEVKARRELARLEVLTEPRAVVIRDAQRQDIDIEEVVLDDTVELVPGAQVPVDAEVTMSVGLRADESLLTGESETVVKSMGDTVLSGSFVVAGHGMARATRVGADSYSSALSVEAKTFRASESMLRTAIDKILRWLTFIIPVASILLLLSLLSTEDRWQDALQGTVAAAVAMVPDGLVLLTSLAFVAGVLELSRRQALAKQLSAVEVLARVDVLCLDKTGTITTGDITFSRLHPLDGDEMAARAALAAIAAADEAPNATMAALQAGAGDSPGWRVKEAEPFSSSRKWSAVSFFDHGWFYLGAPDMLLDPSDENQQLVHELSTAGKRLLAVVTAGRGPDGDVAPADSKPVALLELEDEIRPDAAEILAYFADQKVRVKVISGDNHETVAAIADRAGLQSSGQATDARTLPDEPVLLGAALDDADIFGRVAPRQKQAMVRALQSKGHVVAMTGDGVNDVLALKDADLGIAMGSGSPATRSVADLVLVDDSFSTLPVVVREGRKVINNVERVANLFVTKAVYAVLLTVLVAVVGVPFPFLPRHLTLIGAFSIGVPGLLLALAPEVERIRDGFLPRVMRFSVPSGLIAGLSTFIAYEAARRWGDLSLSEARTLATGTLLAIGLAILATASRPLRPWKALLVAAMGLAYCVLVAVPWTREFFEIDMFTGTPWLIAAAAVAVASVLIAMVGFRVRRNS